MLHYVECGWPLDHQRSRQPRARTSGRIIGGEESNEDAWPWQVITTIIQIIRLLIYLCIKRCLLKLTAIIYN